MLHHSNRKAMIVSCVAIGILLLGANACGDAALMDWGGPENNYPLNWSYSPQQAITAQNVADLQVKWTFPVPAAPPPFSGAEGAMVTPLIYEGIIFTVTNWHRVYALDAKNGRIVWYRDLPLTANHTRYLQPSVPGPLGVPLGHYHSMILTTRILGGPLVWVISNTYQIFALNALTGDLEVNFNPFLADLRDGINGNHGNFDVDTPSILIDEARGILMFSPSVSEGDSAGRGFLEAWNISSGTPQRLWRTFMIPPQDGSDQGWALGTVANMSHAYIFDGTTSVDLKKLSQDKLQGMLRGDWGTFGFNGTKSFAGAGAGWGGAWAIDEGTGTAYVGTSTASPDWNSTFRPGPNLWTDSVLAIDDMTGRIGWAFQAMPHSLGDLDCSWNVILANETIGGQSTKVVYKGCKSGYIFALDASTGSMLWYLRPPSIRWLGVQFFNPLNSTQMREIRWYGYPGRGPITENPSDTGSLESDIAFDPTSNMIFAATYNDPKRFELSAVGPTAVAESVTQWDFTWGVKILNILPIGEVNTTVYGIDAISGKPRWNYTITDLPYRGGLTVSGGVLYVSTLDGTLRMLDSTSGRLLSSRSVGGSLLTQPSIGTDSNGIMTVVTTDMGSTRWGPPFPGFVEAFDVQGVPQAPLVPVWVEWPLLVLLGIIVGAGLGYLFLRRPRQQR